MCYKIRVFAHFENTAGIQQQTNYNSTIINMYLRLRNLKFESPIQNIIELKKTYDDLHFT